MQKVLETLQKRLYQLIIARLDGNNVLNNEYRDNIFNLVHKGIGGFILFGGRRHEITGFVEELQSASNIPLFIASDIERGVGQQVAEMTHFPCLMAIASAIDRNISEDVLMLKDIIYAVAEEAKEVGINMPLIPVLDVNKNPDNPIICTRAFSDDPYTVAWFGSQVIRTLEEAGLISCAKHFPGHGDTSVDSHISLPVISKSLKDLHNTDLVPFKSAIKENISALMIGHLSIPAIDSAPSSISGKVINGLLRKDMGFDGLILTDALNMSALKNMGNIPARCLNAGASVLLHPDDAVKTVAELENALKSGEIDEDIIDLAVSYILRAKEKILDYKNPPADLIANAMLSKKTIQRSITLVKNQKGTLPVREFNDCSLIFAGDMSFFESSVLRGYFKNATHIFDSTDDLQETAVLAIFSSVAAWRGSSGISDSEIQKVKELMQIAKKSIIISFGSPYILRRFSSAGVLIAAYDTAEYYQEAVAGLLKGKGEFMGHLPIRLYEV